MEQVLNYIAQMPGRYKIALLVALPILVVAGYWNFVYSDLRDAIASQDSQIRQLTQEKKEYEQRKKEYIAFRNEVNQLIEEQKELLRVLPKDDQIEQFIESVNSQVELAGLSKVASVRDKAVPEEMYIRLPVKMSLVGSFFQINRFFKNVAELQRIVTIADLSLTPAAGHTGPGAGANAQLRADFVAQTYQLNEAGPGKKKGQKTTSRRPNGGK